VTLACDVGQVHNRTGLFVVRVRIEGDLAERWLRARITHTVDLDAGAGVVTAAATTDDVFFAVREWLEAYFAGCGKGSSLLVTHE
jgi:hypothetical protein